MLLELIERLIETGYPRNDFLTNYTEEDVLNIKKKLGIPLDKKGTSLCTNVER